MYEVESIEQEEDGLYLVRWSGYPSSENSWEPLENIEHTDAYAMFLQRMIDAEEEQATPRRRGRPRRQERPAEPTPQRIRQLRRRPQPTPPPHPDFTDEPAGDSPGCIVCLEHKPQMANACGHMLCVRCSKHMYNSREDVAKCPLCRAQWNDVRRVHVN